jgi:hypothetical protein
LRLIRLFLLLDHMINTAAAWHKRVNACPPPQRNFQARKVHANSALKLNISEPGAAVRVRPSTPICRVSHNEYLFGDNACLPATIGIGTLIF